MLLVEAKGLKHTIGERILFNIEQLAIHSGDQIGLVGRNGSGKTTLLQCLADMQVPEEGSVTSYVETGVLPQLKEQIAEKSGGEITQQYIQQAFVE